MKKSDRLAAIKTIVSQQKIATQQELSQALADQGISLTQATISRLIAEAGIVKFSEPDGSFAYGFAGQKSHLPALNQNQHLLSVRQQGQLLNLQVVPGTSRLIKRLLLTDFGEQIFSLIADDDSLLLVATSAEAAQAIAQDLSTKGLEEA